MEAADEAMIDPDTDPVRRFVVHCLRFLALDAASQVRHACAESAPAWVRVRSPLDLLLGNFSEFVGAIASSEEWVALRERDSSVFELEALVDLLLMASERGTYDLRRTESLETDALWILIRRLANMSLRSLDEGPGPIPSIELLCSGTVSEH